MDMEILNPYYAQGMDTYWCSNRFDWAIKKFHEGYYQVTGKWLIENIKKIGLI